MIRSRMKRSVSLIALFAVSGVMAFSSSMLATAATPDNGTLVAPATTGSLEFSWSGTIGPGVQQTSTGTGVHCTPTTPGNATTDPFHLHLSGLTPSYYTSHAAFLRIEVDWTPSTSSDANQLAVSAGYFHNNTLDGGYTGGRGGNSPNTLMLTYENPPELMGNDYVYIGVCAAYNVSNQDYKAKAVLTVQPLTLDDNTVTLAHQVHHDFAAVVGTYQDPEAPISTSTTTCPPNVCESTNVRVQYPSERTEYLKTHKTTVHFHLTWPDNSQDFDLYVTDPSGNVYAPGTPDGSGYDHTDIDLTNPLDGVWLVRSTAFVVTTPTTSHIDVSLTSEVVTQSGIQLPPEPAARPGDPSFTNYLAPAVSPWNIAGDNEPSIGINSKTGAVMYKDRDYTARISFDDKVKPAKATWTDVTPPTAVSGLDPILFTDPITNRTINSDLQGPCSNDQYSDDDGQTWVPTVGCGVPAGPDHQSIGGGPYPPGFPLASALYPNALYYCSQGVVNAICARSDDGGLTFGAGVPMYDGTQCAGQHGHVKVAKDGTAYVPNKDCGATHNASVVVSEDAGTSWSIRSVPQSANPEAVNQGIISIGDQNIGDQLMTTDFSVGHDPSVGTALDDGAVYFGYVFHHGQAEAGNTNATSLPMIAVSHDRGKTWSNPVDVGAQLGIKNADFAEVVGGDHGRAAFAFIGTRTAGVSYDASFTGEWFLYVSFTSDGGKTWNTVNATRGNPLQRGCVWNVGDPTGTATQCRNMLDFNDIAIDPQGRIYVAYTDGCTGTCETGGTAAYTATAALVRQDSGFSIVSDCGTSFAAGCAVPALQSRPSGVIPDTSAPPPVGSLVWLGGLLAVPVGFASLASVRRRRRRSASDS